jgi:peptide/nickel transport system substrate-binding protein
MIVNAAVAAAAGDQFGMMPTGAGVGAYEPVRFSPNEEVVLQAKADYWAGPVCIEELRFIYYPNANLTYEAFVNGQMDAAFLREAPLIAKAREEDRELLVTQSGLGGVIFVNNRANSPGTDLRVRQAVAWAIDPEIIDERVYDGQGIATTALVGPDSRYAGLVGTPYRPDEAKALVAQLTAEGSFDGSLRLVCTDNPVSKNLALTVEAMLGSVGITVTSEFQASIGIAMLNGDFDLACNGVNVYDAAPYVGLSQFHTNGVNRVGFSNPEFDAAVVQLKEASTEADVQAALEELQDLWNELVPSVGFAAMEEVVVISPDLAGVRLTQDANVSFSTAYFDR